MLYEWIKEKAKPYTNHFLCDENMQMTYGELFEKAEALGKTLKKQKYGILFNNEMYSTIAILACIYAHKTAVMLSSRYGIKHSEKIISEIAIDTVITDDGIKTLSPPLPEREDLTDVSLILCTSGTTGFPKGAMLTEESIKTNLTDLSMVCLLKPNETIVITRPMLHCSIIICEFLFSLIKGVNIVFCNNTFDPMKTYALAQKYNISILGGTPSTLYQISRYVKKMENITTVICSGECMTKQVAIQMRHSFPNSKIYHAYGMTEASPRISVLPPHLFDTFPDSVGYPLKSTSIKIENGELLIKGQNLMKGYYGDKKLHAEWFHTGDSASIKNGLLYIHGRIDDMIIRQGVNIYPAEIECMVKADPRVHEACAFGTQDNLSSQKIELYIESETLTEREAYQLCLNVLPISLMPDKIKVVDKIPKTTSGKLKRDTYGKH